MADSRFVELKYDPKRVVLGGRFEIEDEYLHEFFRSSSASDYDELLTKALVLGAYAFREERIAAFLGRVESELDGRLEELKMLFKVRTLKEKATTVGVEAEADIGSVLQDYIDQCGWEDVVVRTGEKVGTLPRRKVGDLVSTIEGSSTRIVIESKLDSSVQLGDPSKSSAKPEGTAFGQNLTALINREAAISVFVSDRPRAHATILHASEGIMFQPEIPAFIAIIDTSVGDWTNLKVAYGVARALALHSTENGDLSNRVLLVAKRLMRDLDLVLALDKELSKISTAAEAVGKSVAEMRKVLDRAVESAKRSEKVLMRMIAGAEIPEIEWKEFHDEST